MKRIGYWGTALLLLAVCFAVTACGGAMEETAEEPAAEEAAPAQEPGEEPSEVVEIIGEATAALDMAATEPAAAQPIATEPPPVSEPTATPDFGSIAYDVPQQMVRSEAVQVILLVSPSQEDDLAAVLVEELESVGQDPDNVQTANVEVAKRMSASLTSAPSDAFEIVPLQAGDEQLLSDDEPTQWEWSVVPLQGGTHRLILRIDRLVERDGIVEPFKEEVHRDDVTVEVPVEQQLQDAWGGFDFKWLAGVLIFPLFFYWLSRRDSKKDQTE